MPQKAEHERSGQRMLIWDVPRCYRSELEMSYYYVPKPPVAYTVYVPQQCYSTEQRLAAQSPDVFYQPPPQYYCYQPPATMRTYQPPAQVYQPPPEYYFEQAPAQAYAYQSPAVKVSESGGYGGYCGYGGYGGIRWIRRLWRIRWIRRLWRIRRIRRPLRILVNVLPLGLFAHGFHER